MAARMFTFGYRFVSPPTAVVYHLYSRSHRPVPPPVDMELRKRSLKRVTDLLNNETASNKCDRLMNERFGIGIL